MDAYTLSNKQCRLVPDQTVATELPKPHSPSALFTVIFTLLISLTLSGCLALTSAGKPGKAGSNSAASGTLAASATNLTFGNVAIGSKSSQTLTLTNTGSAAANISQATISGAGFSTGSVMSSVSIAPGQSQPFQIHFAPQTAGNLSGTIVVASDASNSTLSVYLLGTGMTGLSITTQPASQSVTSGQTATFDATATGTGALTYQWKKNGIAIGGATFSTYTTPVTTASDNSASFAVVVSDSTNIVISNPATLTVTPAPVAPSITAQPGNQTSIAGQSAAFTVSATGTATLTYQWRKNGTAISGANSPIYTVPATAASDNGALFTVSVSNSKGNVTSNAATLTVTVPPAKATLPTIVVQPVRQSVTAGQSATFNVASTGGPLTYQWTKNGAPIDGATLASYTSPATTLADNGASFSVTLSNTAGSITSTSAALAVTAASVAPSITVQPTSHSVTPGQTATFAVSATGTATLTYQWSKNGTAISGATSPIYTVPATAASDNGALFAVSVSNSKGNVTSNAATLTVNVPPAKAMQPAILAQPARQSVKAGQSATFNVVATGAPVTYQWSKNGTPIDGATLASYTTPTTTMADNGASFTVAVSNDAGSITSNSSALAVTAASVAPSIVVQPTSHSITAGQTATFVVSATGTATLTYQWKKSGIAIVGATSASYTPPATTTSDNGALFTVTVSNDTGIVTSNAATLTVNEVPSLLNASATGLSFAGVNIGGNSSLGMTLTNGGNSNVTVSNVSIAGPGFTASGVSTGQILTPGQHTTLNVTFTPAAAGAETGSATVTSNAANSPATIILSGTGTQPVSHSATLTWAGSSPAAGYNVYRSVVSGGPYTKLNSTLITGTRYVDSAVLAGNTYFDVITSVDPSNVESAFSNEVSATIPRQ